MIQALLSGAYCSPPFLFWWLAVRRSIFGVQVKDAELLCFAMGHDGVAVIKERIPARNNGLIHHPRARQPLGCRFDNFQFDDGAAANPLCCAQAPDRCRDDRIEISKSFKQLASNWLNVSAGDAAEEQKLK